MISIRIGDTVKWSSGRKILGKVIKLFGHRGHSYAVVEDSLHALSVVRVYEKLEVLPRKESDGKV